MAEAGGDGRTRQKRGAARRQQIIDAAVELFAQKGWRSTGLAALADEVGLTAPGLLYYFGNKERLLQEVVAERTREEAYAEIPLEEGGIHLLRDVARRNAENTILMRLYLVLGAESLDEGDPLHDFFVRRYDASRWLVARSLGLDIERGTIRADVDVDQIAREVVALLIGIEMQWLTDPSAFDLVATIDAYLDRLLEDLAP